MIDAKELLERISVDDVITILTELGAQEVLNYADTKGHLITNTICHNISDGKLKLYYFTEDKEGNPKGTFHCFTACGDSFNIYDLVKRNFELRNIEMKFNEIINWICSKLGIENSGYSKPDGFGHREAVKNEELEYLKKFDRKKINVPETKIHDERILYKFSDYKHPSWLEEGISKEAMDYWEVKYDFVNHGIILPYRDRNGYLASLKVRNLDDSKIKLGYKYIPYQTFGENKILYSVPTQFHLFGLYQNEEYIRKIKKVALFESEKSLYKLESWYGRRNFGLSLFGSNLSQWHIQTIISLGVQEVLICLDREYKDIDSEECRIYQQKILRMCQSLVNYVKVSVIVDREGLTPYKSSPVDLSQEIFETLCDQKQIIYSE